MSEQQQNFTKLQAFRHINLLYQTLVRNHSLSITGEIETFFQRTQLILI